MGLKLTTNLIGIKPSSAEAPMYTRLVFLLSVSTLLIAPLSLAQDATQLPPLPDHNSNTFAGSENRWQLVAKDISKQPDTVAPFLRSTRDAYWLHALQRYKDVEHSGLATNIPRGSTSESAAEVPIDPSSIWVVATFLDYSVHPVKPLNQPSETDLILYTEMHYKVDEFVAGAPASALSTGSMFDVDIPMSALCLAKSECGEAVML